MSGRVLESSEEEEEGNKRERFCKQKKESLLLCDKNDVLFVFVFVSVIAIVHVVDVVVDDFLMM